LENAFTLTEKSKMHDPG